MQISRAQIKLYASLRQKKYRTASGLFLAEGHKCVMDTRKFFETEGVLATSAWIEQHPREALEIGELLTQVSAKDMRQISSLSTAPEILAVYHIPPCSAEEFEVKGCLTLLLDGIQDPGNLGTILRVADWFGIRQIVASPDTVDIFNPKSVQATMGAIAKVRVAYANLPDFIRSHPEVPVYGTLLDGKNIYTTTLSPQGLIAFGNEGKGLTPEVRSLITDALYIPPYPGGEQGSESLNVGIATAITVAEFRRRQTSGTASVPLAATLKI